ncbi:unnamed protein product [Anisakis simplex]|uniref:Uncharacterized protein n=1 Tax=Anisakis simplex TaxID=6269 RepID=A0A0M3IZL7_ANISI|nr:unnamed protein product [Anisakis simplex]
MTDIPHEDNSNRDPLPPPYEPNSFCYDIFNPRNLMICFAVYFTVITLCKIVLFYTLFEQSATSITAIYFFHMFMDVPLIFFILLSLLKNDAASVTISIIITVIYIVYHGVCILAATLAFLHTDSLVIRIVDLNLEDTTKADSWILNILHVTDGVGNGWVVNEMEAVEILSRIILCVYPFLLIVYISYEFVAIKYRQLIEDMENSDDIATQKYRPKAPCGIHPGNFC